jgi:hypothetical protein
LFKKKALQISGEEQVEQFFLEKCRSGVKIWLKEIKEMCIHGLAEIIELHLICD